MGDPRKKRKKYETPRFPRQIDVLQTDLKTIGQYGLRNKRELWRHKTMLSRFRGIARSLIGMSAEERETTEKQLLGKLHRLGILPKTAALDDVLDLSLESILQRRIQTLVLQKGLARSVHQARQLITHGHVTIEGKKVSSPSYMVSREEEDKIHYAATSPISKPDHPLQESISILTVTKRGE
jgi:small subunit ribosomal protein S4